MVENVLVGGSLDGHGGGTMSKFNQPEKIGSFSIPYI